MTDDPSVLKRWFGWQLVSLVIVLLAVGVCGIIEGLESMSIKKEPNPALRPANFVTGLVAIGFFIVSVILAFHTFETAGFVIAIITAFIPFVNLGMAVVVHASAASRLKGYGAKVGLLGARFPKGVPD